MKRTFFEYFIELLIAGVIVYFSVKLFLVYFFFLWTWKRYEDTEFIRKSISVTRVSLELKALIIMKKLNVSRKDCMNIEIEYSDKNPEAWKFFHKDAIDIGIHYGEDNRII